MPGTRMIRIVIAVFLMLLVIGDSTPIWANGRKYFKEAIRYAENKQWDKAAERFALAVADEPSNLEYQMHFRRALVNAAILMVERGDRLAEQNDYQAAYNSYRQACALDLSNEVAAIKMRRMAEAQGLTDSATEDSEALLRAKADSHNGVIPTLDLETEGSDSEVQRPSQKIDVIVHNGNLLGIIEQLSQSIRLNVAFDQQVESVMKSRSINIELRDVTAPEALEIILHTNNLSYVQVGARSLVITMDNAQNRARFEPMSVQAFFVKNADVNELKMAVASTIGTKQIVATKQANALVVRDSKPNLELVESLITLLDKSKAEVLIDISLFEVSKNDLLQLGNQLTTASGPNIGLQGLGGLNQRKTVVGNVPRAITGPFAFALGMPASTVSIFQDKGKAKLLASTQVHVLENEQHQIRIGQRVPVKTGSSALLTVGSSGSSGSTGSTPSNGLTSVDNIQYENVGLNIDMQPQVFEDEVQVKMKIESSSVDRSTGDLTPSFNQRTMSSVARMKDGQTTMIAGVSRSEDSKQYKGVPLIGLIPILGRFFTTPTSSSQQSDIVITVTPHILRRADITNKDHLARDAGRGSEQSRQLTIQQIVNRADLRQDRSRLSMDSSKGPNRVQKTSSGSSPSASSRPPVPSGIVESSFSGKNSPGGSPSQAIQVQRRQVPRSKVPPKSEGDDKDDDDDDEDGSAKTAEKSVLISVRCSTPITPVGQDFYVAVLISGYTQIKGANIVLGYDPDLLEVKRVVDSGLLHSQPEYTADGGLLRVNLEQPPDRESVEARGQLILITMSPKKKGESKLVLSGETSLQIDGAQDVTLRMKDAVIEIR